MKLKALMTTLSLTATLATAQVVGLPNQKPQQAQAQTPRPYVILVNGNADCCVWKSTNNLYMPELWDIPNAEFRMTAWDHFKDGGQQRQNIDLGVLGNYSTSNDRDFLHQASDFINNQLDPNRPLILIGHSYGGDSIISLLPRIDRRIQFVGVIDPTAAGGFREPITRRTIPSNVDYFFNRWQENAAGSTDNLVPIDSRVFDGRVDRCNASKDCDETEQNLARNRDGSAIRVSCGSLEVTCPGYEPWPGGSNGTKAKRLEHNTMPRDEYLQSQMVSKIKQAIANFAQSSQPTVANSYLQSPVFDPAFYLLTYEDLRTALNNHEEARQHWKRHGIGEARRSSPAFDVRYYRDIHADLRNVFGNNYSGIVDHWLRHGIGEGRRSSLVFDVKYYLDKYPDLQQAFGRTNYTAAVDHWLRHGVSEGRQGSPEFDPRFYLQNNPDVARAYGANNYMGAVAHYLEFGKNEGRQGAP